MVENQVNALQEKIAAMVAKELEKREMFEKKGCDKRKEMIGEENNIGKQRPRDIVKEVTPPFPPSPPSNISPSPPPVNISHPSPPADIPPTPPENIPPSSPTNNPPPCPLDISPPPSVNIPTANISHPSPPVNIPPPPPASIASSAPQHLSPLPPLRFQCEICQMKVRTKEQVEYHLLQLFFSRIANQIIVCHMLFRLTQILKEVSQVKAHLSEKHGGVLQELGEGPDMLFCTLHQGEHF